MLPYLFFQPTIKRYLGCLSLAKVSCCPLCHYSSCSFINWCSGLEKEFMWSQISEIKAKMLFGCFSWCHEYRSAETLHVVCLIIYLLLESIKLSTWKSIWNTNPDKRHFLSLILDQYLAISLIYYLWKVTGFVRVEISLHESAIVVHLLNRSTLLSVCKILSRLMN